MEDGYFDQSGRSQCTIFCTECYTKADCLLLIQVLESWGIKATLKRRNKANDTYRIRVSKLSMPRLIELVQPHMLPEMMYKLGL